MKLKTVAVVTVIVSSGLALVQGDVPGVQSGSWTAAAVPLSPRAGAASVLLPDGSVLVTGGTADASTLSSVELFNEAGGFAPGASLNTPRADHALALLSDGSVLAIGGRSAEGSTGTCEIYGNGQWTPSASLVEARWGHTATVLKDGRVVVAGGQNESGPVATVEVYDPAAREFSVAGTLGSPRTGHAAAMLHDGRVLFAGGFDGQEPLASIELYDPASASISDGGALSVARAGLTATTLLDGRVLLFGGFDGQRELASAEIFDPASGLLMPAGSASWARRDHDAFLLPANNSVLIVGGVAAGAPMGSTELYRPWAASFVPTTDLNTARMDATGSALATRGRLLVTGGEGVGSGAPSSEIYHFATIETDRDDYAPGDVVTITGTGWQPGETVRLLLQEVRPEHTDRLLTAVADEQGNIFNNSFVPEEHHLGIRFYLTATGAGSEAQTTFTDGRLITSVTLNGGSTVTVAPGAPITVVVNVNVTNDGSPNTRNWRGTSWQVGPGNGRGICINTADYDSAGSYSETFVIDAPSTAGTYDATFRAYGDSACNGQSSNYPMRDAVTVESPDAVAPTTAIVLGPSAPNGNSDWYTQSVHVLVTSGDNPGGSGVADTRCVLDPATPPENFDGMPEGCAYLGTGAAVVADGSHTLYAASRDAAGNTEAVTSRSFNIDQTAPVVDAEPNRGPDANGWYNHPLTITAVAQDATSGIDSCEPETIYAGPDTDSTSVSATCSDVAGNVATASYAFKYDSTGPVATATPDRAPDHNGWYNHALTATFSATDATAGVDSCDAAAVYSGPDDGDAGVSGSCRDLAGNTATASYSFRYDATAPGSVTAAADRGPDSNGWYNHALTVTWTGTDALSGVAACTAIPYAGPDASAASLAGNCSDAAGNSSAPVAFGLSYDATAPAVVHNPAADSCSLPGNSGWCRATQTAAFLASDATSGFLAPVAGNSYEFTQSTGANGGAIMIASGSVTDAAGNVAAGVAAGPYKIDSVAPTIVFDTPAAGSPYLLNQSVAAVFSCADALAGFSGGLIVTGTSPGCNGAAQVDTSSVGAGKVFPVTATDLAGNTSAGSVLYAVQYGVCVLYDESKAVRQNATVPIKVALCDAHGVNQSSPGVVLHALGVTPEAGTLTGILEDAGQANPDYDFRYTAFPTGGGYIFNLSTKGIPAGVWRLHFTASNDPVTHTVIFGVK